jgi:tight adherence protein B
MLLPLVVFLFVGGIVALLGFLGFKYGPGEIAKRRLELRLREVSTGGGDSDDEGESTVVRREADGPLPAVERVVLKTQAGSKLALLIEQSGVKITPSGIILASFGIAGGAGLLGLLFVPSAFIIVVPFLALVAGFLPFAWLRWKRSSRLKKFEEQFPDALDVLSRAVRAGHAFQAALGMAADELPEPVGPELKKAFEQQNFGLPLREALGQLAERVPILDVRFFVTAVLIQRDTGGNLAEILDNLSHVVRERFKILRQVRVHTAHGRFTGYVLLGLPPFLAVALTMIDPDHMAPLFREHLGHLMLEGTIVMQVIGYFWIRKVMKIEV